MNDVAELEAPSGWRVIQLRELARITAGGDYDAETASPVETDRYPFPVYANAIERKAFHSYSSTSKHPAGAVTITARGTLGFSQFRSKPFTAIGRLLVVWPNAQFDGRYLAEYLNSQVEFAVESTGVPQLTGPQAGSYEILIPEIVAEQEAIAEALSDADALIEGLERLIAKKRLIKQGAMQDLLTAKRRLPGFSGDWVSKKLGERGQFFKGSGVRKDEAKSGFLPCVRYGELYTLHHDVVRDFASFISADVAQTARSIKSGDILSAGSGETKAEIGKCAVVTFEGEMYAGGDIIVFRPSGDDPVFLSYLLNAPAVQKQKAQKGQGDAVVHISATALGDLDLLLPSKEEQSAISAVIEDMDAEIQALETRLNKARQVKEGMMQNLLTGRIRLV